MDFTDKLAEATDRSPAGQLRGAVKPQTGVREKPRVPVAEYLRKKRKL